MQSRAVLLLLPLLVACGRAADDTAETEDPEAAARACAAEGSIIELGEVPAYGGTFDGEAVWVVMRLGEYPDFEAYVARYACDGTPLVEPTRVGTDYFASSIEQLFADADGITAVGVGGASFDGAQLRVFAQTVSRDGTVGEQRELPFDDELEYLVSVTRHQGRLVRLVRVDGVGVVVDEDGEELAWYEAMDGTGEIVSDGTSLHVVFVQRYGTGQIRRWAAVVGEEPVLLAEGWSDRAEVAAYGDTVMYAWSEEGLFVQPPGATSPLQVSEETSLQDLVLGPTGGLIFGGDFASDEAADVIAFDYELGNSELVAQTEMRSVQSVVHLVDDTYLLTGYVQPEIGTQLGRLQFLTLP